jgi:hypothetical protein
MLGLETFRDRLPTSPHDLSQYAFEQTGPASWSARPDADALSAWALEAHDDPFCARTTDLLVEISPDDVPHVTLAPEEIAQRVNHREAFVVASIDGQSTCAMLVDVVDLPSGEVLAILCNLCARGLVDLERAAR